MTVKVRPARGKDGQRHEDGRDGWEYDIYFAWAEGGLFRERKNSTLSSKSATLHEAERRERSLRKGTKAEYEASKKPVLPVKPVVTFKDYWPRFVRDHYRASRKKPSTIAAAENIYKVHLGPAFDAKTLTEISTSDIAELKGDLSEHRPKTVNNILVVLSKALKMAVKWKVIRELPCEIELLPIAKKTMPFYEVHDYRRLVESARKISTNHLCLVLLAGSAGLRRGELMALKWTDLDLERRLIKVERAIWKKHEEVPKGGHGRVVPMTQELYEALKQHRHLRHERVLYSTTTQGAQFADPSLNGLGPPKGLDGSALRAMMGQVLRRATMAVEGADAGAIHILRHTFCSHLAMANVPAKAIQELAGHADLVTTLQYMHLAPGDRGRAMAMLSSYYTAEGLEQGRSSLSGKT